MSLPPFGTGRFRGALLGLACGDALGASLPPGAREPAGLGAELAGGGPLGLAAGEWTDDTATALCLAESLAEQRAFVAGDQLARTRRWLREAHLTAMGRCVGARDALSLAVERFEQGLAPLADAGKGDPSVIARVAPVALCFAPHPREAIATAAAAARTTSGARAEIDACRYLAALLVGALEGRTEREILAAGFSPVPGLWDEEPLDDEVRAVAQGATPAGGSPAVAALAAALEALRGSPDFEAGCLRACGSGAEPDLAGAVFGQLGGALRGELAIPSRWRRRLQRRATVAMLAERLHEVASSRVPPPPLAGASWIEPGIVLAGPCPDAAAIAPLLHAGVSVFVDLAEPGEGAPYWPEVERRAAVLGRPVAHHRLPIRAGDVPGGRETRAVLDAIAAARRGGAVVYVHGPSGRRPIEPLGACRLVERGMSAAVAFARLAELRAFADPGAAPSPPAAAQLDFVRAWEREAAAPPGGNDAIRAALAAVDLGEPLTHEGVTLFPLLRRGAAEPPAYVTFEQARDRRDVLAREVSEAGSVPEIEIIHRGVAPVLLLEGEELVGAKQNRIVNLTVLVPPRESRVVPVTCVEQGRWSYTSRDFEGSSFSLYPSLRGQASLDVSRSLGQSGVRLVDQRVVWRDIARMSERLGARTTTGAMNAIFTGQDRAVAASVAAFAPEPAQVGAVFAVHGRVVGFDLFDAPVTLRAALPKLVAGYALEALADVAAPAVRVDRAEARRLLDAVAAAPARAYAAVGLGWDLRVTTDALTGSALATRAGVIHASAFWAQSGA